MAAAHTDDEADRLGRPNACPTATASAVARPAARPPAMAVLTSESSGFYFEFRTYSAHLYI